MRREYTDRHAWGRTLIDEATAPGLHNGWLWGPASIFDKQELAAHRRDAILHLLRCYTGGLQFGQLLEQLLNCSRIYAPINKDAVRADLIVLDAEGKAKRKFKKWVIADKKD